METLETERSNNILHFKTHELHHFPKIRPGQEWKSNSLVETPCKHHVTEGWGPHHPRGCHVPGRWRDETRTSPLQSFSLDPQPQLNEEDFRQTQVDGLSTKHLTSTPRKCQDQEARWKTEKRSQTGGDRGGVTTGSTTAPDTDETLARKTRPERQRTWSSDKACSSVNTKAPESISSFWQMCHANVR